MKKNYGRGFLSSYLSNGFKSVSSIVTSLFVDGESKQRERESASSIANIEKTCLLLGDQVDSIKKTLADVSEKDSALDVLRLALADLLEKNSKLECSIGQLRDRNEELSEGSFSYEKLNSINSIFSRNILPNMDATVQKLIKFGWSKDSSTLTFRDLLDSGFRVFSQNDEDGILLRLFSKIGETNKNILEIGSNCFGSDVGIPENLSTNLVINHGWNAAIFELDETECSRTVDFFARALDTKHFHDEKGGGGGYYSPRVYSGEVTPENIKEKLDLASLPKDLDLLIVDIDGGDFELIEALDELSPRVIVVEFEKRFRDRYSVKQTSGSFSSSWKQSGSVSLPAWEILLGSREYVLCSINRTCFNAFFVKKDVAKGNIEPISSAQAFDFHPIFSAQPEEFWYEPDETWEKVV